MRNGLQWMDDTITIEVSRNGAEPRVIRGRWVFAFVAAVVALLTLL